MALISYKIYLEMAQMGRGEYHGDVSKNTLNFDEDDLDFLNQFDHQFWPAAIAQRWDLFHDALKKLHDIRKSKIQEGRLVEKIENFLRTGSPSDLPEKLIERLKSDHGPIPVDMNSKSQFRNISSTIPVPDSPDAADRERATNDRERDIERKKLKIIRHIAEDEAFEYIKPQTENLKSLGLDEEVQFSLRHPGKRGRTSDTNTTKVKAKPFLNRMYHRLERTEGEPHTEESENTGVGRYGYDLSHPKEQISGGETRKLARGTNWVGAGQWVGDIRKYLQHSSHGHFGSHPDEHSASWKPITLSTNSNSIPTYLEDPTYDWLLEIEAKKQEKIIKKTMYEELQRAAIASGDKNKIKVPELTKQQEKEAKKAAENVLKSKIEEEGLYAPPVDGVDIEERKYKIVNGEVVKPIVYLPFDENDKLLLKPSTYLKTIKKEIIDKEGNKVANPKYADALKKSKQIWGAQKRPEIPVMMPTDPNDKLHGTEGIRTFAPTLNKNARGQSFINHLTDRGQKIMEMYLPKKNISYAGRTVEVIPALYYGILYCLNSSQCAGGAPARLRNLLKSRLLDVHNFIFTQLLSNLGSVKKWGQQGMEPGEPGYNNLVYWAKDRTTDIIQNIPRTSWGEGGEGTRRQGYTTSTVPISQDAEGRASDPSATGYTRSSGRTARVGVGQSHTAKNFQDIFSELEEKEKEIEAAEREIQDTDIEGSPDPENDSQLSAEEQNKKLEDYLKELAAKAGGQTNLMGAVQRAEAANDEFYDLAKQMLWAIWQAQVDRYPRRRRPAGLLTKRDKEREINAQLRSWKDENVDAQSILKYIKERDDYKELKRLAATPPQAAATTAPATVQGTSAAIASPVPPAERAGVRPRLTPTARPLPRAVSRPSNTASSPLSRFRRTGQSTEQPTGDIEPATEWENIKDLPISERVKYFKEKLR
jgi:hypothetical protein